MSELCWSLESLAVRAGTIAGYGWVFHRRQDLVSVRLGVSLAEGGEHWFPVDIGKPREDIGHRHQDIPSAAYSGFAVFAAIPVGARLTGLRLACELPDGTRLAIELPPALAVRLDVDGAASPHQRLWQLRAYATRAWALLRAGQLGMLREKIERYIGGRPKSALHDSASLVRLLAAPPGGPICLVVDHDLGGGANHYRERYVEGVIAAGGRVLVLSYHVATLSHLLILRAPGVDARFSIPARELLVEALRSLAVTEIVYNTAASLARSEQIPRLLVELQRMTSARLSVLIHDFHPVCPSHFLLDYQGRYCHLPEPQVCNNCLVRNRHGFAALFEAGDINAWRASWGELLAAADRVVAFSVSSARILRKAYPQLDEARLQVVPHRVDYLPARSVKVTSTARLCIGVVGQIGLHKGAAVVQQLAEEIRRRGLGLRIIVIGAIETRCDPDIVSQTGPYRRDDLPVLIERSGANVMLFPSIWPETFSYVVQEMIELDLPVAAFDFGAPAERLAGYAKGLVLHSMAPAVMLDALLDFHRKLYPDF